MYYFSKINKINVFNFREINTISTTDTAIMTGLTDEGKTYYIDAVNGNDSNTGLTKKNAWATLAKVENTLIGDQSDKTVLLKRGCTWNEQLVLSMSGTSGHPFTISAYGTGAKPIIDATRLITNAWTQVGATTVWYADQYNSISEVYHDTIPLGAMSTSALCTDNGGWYWDGGEYWRLYVNHPAGDPGSGHIGISRRVVELRGSIDLNGRSYVTIDNIRFRNNEEGILDDNAASVSNLMITNCEFYHSPTAMYIVGELSNFTINNNVFYRCQSGIKLVGDVSIVTSATISGNTLTDMGTVDGTNPWHEMGDPESISFQNVSNSTITRNTISGGAILGPYFYQHTSDSYNNEISYNTILDNGNTVFSIEHTADYNFYGNTFKYNIIKISSGKVGIGLFQGTAPSGMNYFYNNVFYGGLRAVVHYGGASGYMTFKNNIFAHQTDYHTVIDAAVTNYSWSNNLYEYSTISGHGAFEDGAARDFTYWKANYDTSGVQGDPLFMGVNDYRLQQGSPAIDAGVPVGLLTDYAGNTISGAPDIGAYEKQ